MFKILYTNLDVIQHGMLLLERKQYDFIRSFAAIRRAFSVLLEASKRELRTATPLRTHLLVPPCSEASWVTSCSSYLLVILLKSVSLLTISKVCRSTHDPAYVFHAICFRQLVEYMTVWGFTKVKPCDSYHFQEGSFLRPRGQVLSRTDAAHHFDVVVDPDIQWGLQSSRIARKLDKIVNPVLRVWSIDILNTFVMSSWPTGDSILEKFPPVSPRHSASNSRLLKNFQQCFTRSTFTMI